MTQQTLDTSENWGASAGGYARIATILMQPFAEAFTGILAPEPGARLLEVAAGTGAMTASLAERAGHVLATDFAPEMIAALEKRLGDGGVGNVDCAVMDGQKLDVPDAGFDCAVCAFGLMLFPDRAAGFLELHRALRPGGKALVATWASPDRVEAFSALGGAIRRTFPEMPPPKPPAIFSLSDSNTFREEMAMAGFEDVEIHEVTRTSDYGRAETAWELSTNGAPPAIAMRKMIGEAGMEKLRDVYIADLKGRFGSAPVRFENTALVATGRYPMKH